jgi:pimeloyl-ACP methyl ester carboxylesterase
MKRVFCQERFITDQAVDEIHSLLSKRMNVLNLIHAARSAKKDNLLHELKNVRMPTLLLWGEDDEVTTMGVAETFATHIPNSTLVSIKNCGHAPMIEHPDWFNEQVKNFLAKHARKRKAVP